MQILHLWGEKWMVSALYWCLTHGGRSSSVYCMILTEICFKIQMWSHSFQTWCPALKMTCPEGQWLLVGSVTCTSCRLVGLYSSFWSSHKPAGTCPTTESYSISTTQTVLVCMICIPLPFLPLYGVLQSLNCTDRMRATLLASVYMSGVSSALPPGADLLVTACQTLSLNH